MNKQQILDAQIRRIEGELVNAYSEHASCTAKVRDSETTTGNAAADKNLADGATIAKNTLAMVGRMIETREAQLADLNAQMAALNQPAKQ